jgi:quinol monooxygenase YgiN
MSAVIVVTATFTPRPGKTEELVDVLRATIAKVHRERGCLRYALHAADDGTLVLLEKWSRIEDLEAHSAGGAVAELHRGLPDLVEFPPVVRRLVPVQAGDPDVGRF